MHFGRVKRRKSCCLHFTAPREKIIHRAPPFWFSLTQGKNSTTKKNQSCLIGASLFLIWLEICKFMLNWEGERRRGGWVDGWMGEWVSGWRRWWDKGGNGRANGRRNERARARGFSCLGMSRLCGFYHQRVIGGNLTPGIGFGSKVRSHTFSWRGFRMQIPPRGFSFTSVENWEGGAAGYFINWIQFQSSCC